MIEALRLQLVTLDEICQQLPRRRAAPRLRAVCDAVADLPIARCKSNAEATALVRRKAAGREPVHVNLRIAGHEADLVDLERREITEIDGRAFHHDADKDAEATRNWQAAGFTVGRRPSDDAYEEDAAW